MKTSLFCSRLFAVALLGAGVVGCGSSSTTSTTDADGSPAAESSLTGDIQINGSSTVLPIGNAIKEQFDAEFPNVNITVGGAGTGNGFKDFADKTTDISEASRPIKAGEWEACKASGVEFVELPVAYDGLTIVIHPENDWVKQLTVDQLKAIFVGSEAANKWSEVDPSWPDREIKIFAPGVGSGTYDYFHEVLAKKDKAALREDMTLNEDDNVLVQGVAGNKDSIGFFGVAYYEENKDKLQAVPVVNPDSGEAVLPNKETIASGEYAPFSRPLFIYVNAESLNKAQVQAFVEYFLENVPETAEKVGYVRLPEEVMARSVANLDALKTGSHFVDADGESRSGSVVDIFTDENLISE
ncbi:PstS family phosphate ABC transporter substrate-binding protein [Roseimaritima ulvae]|uniref:Phosphate-binding protein n=1 Tax=Roseimaritima ulvae TaxID=980254 RepID=A0A5B9QXC5_9BACT|nr:PstS family phosphate ABC transporter substrate-binding protein [Roseimaritima ulvae]QEG42460.1 Phosphate-binding protein PstS precursor [Roseimaritima ulvae]